MLLILRMGLLAQWFRALASHARGHRFESRRAHHECYPFHEMLKSTILILLMIGLMPDSNANDVARMDEFGTSIAMGDGYLFISETGGFQSPGTVHIYIQGEDQQWVLNQSLQGLDAQVGDRFGTAIAYSDGVLAVADGSKVYVFEHDHQPIGSFVQSALLTSSAPTFGSGALALDQGWLAVGTSLRNGFTGPVYLYSNSEQGEWTQQALLEEPSVWEDSMFGVALSMDQGSLLVGAPNACEAYLYAYMDGQWGLSVALPCGELGQDSMFGMSLDLKGSLAVITAPRANDYSGVVTVWHPSELDPPKWISSGSIVSRDQNVPYMMGSHVHILDEQQIIVGAPVLGRMDDGTAEPNVRIYSPSEGGYWDAPYTTLPDIVLTPRSVIESNGAMLTIGMPSSAYGEGTAQLMTLDAGTWKKAQELIYVGQQMPRQAGMSCGLDGMAGEFDCGRVDLVSFLPNEEMDMNRGVRLNDVWGWTDPETAIEYGLVGHMEGTAFIDLSNPALPKYLGTLPRTAGSPGSTWRDIKVYQDHAYIVADRAKTHGMQIFDLRQLRDLTDTPVEFEVTAHYDLIHSAHNIVINEETGFGFAVGASGGGNTCGGGLHMIDLREPQSPEFVGCFADETTGRSRTGYSHDAQCVIYHGPDSNYAGREICFGANETALSIADVTDKENPVSIASATYPNATYVHQGWLTEDHTYFFQNDELDELAGNVEKTRTMVWDVSELSDPIMIREFFGPTSATDHNLYIHGDVMYQTNNAVGLRIIDISSPEDPLDIGHFDTTPYGFDDAGFNGTWSSYPYFDSGMIIVTSRREGLFVLKKQSLDI